MAKESIQKDILLRLTVVYIAVSLFAFLIIAKVFYLQFFEYEKWNKATEINLKEMIVEPNRGDILAVDKRVLACSVPFYEIRWDSRCESVTNSMFYSKVDSLAYCLSRLFGDKSSSEYRRELVSARNRGERYYLLKRYVSYDQLKRLKTYPLFRLGKYKGGFIYLQSSRRIQPFGDLATRTIGYTTKTGTFVGIEGSFNKELRGDEGYRLMQKIAGGIWMPVNDGNEIEPDDGLDVITTIDVNIQDVAQAALRKQLIRHNASHGTAVLMEVETGEIRAIVNLTRESEGYYVEKYNYAIGESTEPGSTFKLAALMAALEDGYIEPEDIFDTGKGIIYYKGFPVRDTKEEGYGKISVQHIFEVSSNVGVTKIIDQFYRGKEKKFIDRLYSMGLNESLHLQLYGEEKPYIKYPGDPLWSGISLTQMAYGYEVKLTPLQILTFYNAVANNGRMVKPLFIKALSRHGSTVRTFHTEVINPSICSRSTLRKAHKMLEGVVENGTAMNLKNTGYKIAGKTGTAQLAQKSRGYKIMGGISYQASFAGYFPASKPKYSCIVVVAAPSNSVYYGNLVAGPVFKEIADKVYSVDFELQREIENDDKTYAQSVPKAKAGKYENLDYLFDFFDIPSNIDDLNTDWIGTESVNTEIKCYVRPINSRTVPNVKGMGLRDALQVLELNGLSVTVIGRGTVIRQSVQPGQAISGGGHIVIELS